MALKVFSGASISWADVNNWAGVIPASADDVVVPDTTQTLLTDDLDRTGDDGGAGLHLNSIYVAKGRLTGIGSDGNPLKCTVQNSEIDEASIIHRSAGAFYFNSQTGTGGHVTGAILVTSDNGDNLAMTLGGDRNIGRLLIRKGHVTLSAAFSATLSSVELSWLTSIANDASLTLSSCPGAAVSLIEVAGGIVIASRAVIRLMMGTNGEYTQENYGLGELLQVGGTVAYKTDEAIGSLGVASIMGGVLDLTQGSNTKLIDNLYEWPNATVRKNRLVTITNDHSFDNEEA